MDDCKNNKKFYGKTEFIGKSNWKVTRKSIKITLTFEWKAPTTKYTQRVKSNLFFIQMKSNMKRRDNWNSWDIKKNIESVRTERAHTHTHTRETQCNFAKFSHGWTFSRNDNNLTVQITQIDSIYLLPNSVNVWKIAGKKEEPSNMPVLCSSSNQTVFNEQIRNC